MGIYKCLILLVVTALLSACAETPVEDTKTVKTAKACERAKENNPGILQGFKIGACTYNGVWIVDQLDETGQAVKHFDFVNQEYAGPESQGNLMSVLDMGLDAPVKFQAIRQTINEKLLAPPS